MTLVAGTQLGRYEIRSQIGAGGMGEVYLAEDTELRRTVAIKILPEAPGIKPAAIAALCSRGQSSFGAQSSTHPHHLRDWHD